MIDTLVGQTRMGDLVRQNESFLTEFAPPLLIPVYHKFVNSIWKFSTQSFCEAYLDIRVSSEEDL